MTKLSSGILQLSDSDTLNMNIQWFELASQHHFWFKWRINAALNQLQHIGFDLGSRLRVLDIGGGTGILASQIETETSWIVDICDLDEEALSNARPIKGCRFLYNIMDEVPSMLQAYDMIILYDVIEHIEQSIEFIRASIKHLKPGGYCLINVPALQFFYSEYDRAMGHQRRYDRHTIMQEFENTSMNVVDIRYWGFLLLPALAMRKIILKFMSSKKTIVRAGFSPPGKWINALLWVMAKTELYLLPQPYVGSSLMAIYKKPSI